ncbi:fimbria/pilus periplasmic chaperone [Serratia marcescens]|uniref:fimbria/pilus periplasmic chaperone n=1 Tax=Serratia marcescens TaxID=615 RepID=UPI0018D721F0|nr:fimbria/pilus periplasmic chaperone [Serratia marcescens]MBH2769062.1 fimbria/pilus periplasmic chaperone [Serratia marcescens]MDK1710454.1 fimbria/pilus periplasmic chaperone [Serratia marcescens]
MKQSLFPLMGGLLASVLGIQQAQAAIALDRTRVVFNGGDKSTSLSVSNENKQLPYLAQGWVEDAQGNKITTPLTVLPPLQRLEPGAKSQIKVQALPAANLLAQDRETLFYFNLREIPPKSEKPNTLQLALQTRIKLFYRPKALSSTEGAAPWQEQLTLTKMGDKYQVNNPTPYYITIVDASNKPGAVSVKGFEPVMVAPKGKEMLNVGVSALGNAPVLTYVNDYGGRPQLQFNCSGVECKANPVKPS